MLKVRKMHRFMGLLLMVPFLVWAATGLIFFVKPGYKAAYESLQTPQLPLEALALPDIAGAREIRVMRTQLGDSLFIRDVAGWRHLDAKTGVPKQDPSEAELQTFFAEAISGNPLRYGSIVAVEGMQATTSTGVEITLDWSSLKLYQYGRDTKHIDWFYKLHYLQWTGHAGFDRFLGISGLVLLVAMTFSGMFLLFGSSKQV